ncbi:hypothetical protein MUK42_04500 [Musa troglodytarum]|uniref:Uncharacterized protein n=1 Tax=Musa troglodytarum TaxID=320322 RepID=A0A9E7JRW4_9LILI|nr:hypothetical protein MUK42_04500 [Musa troglodytarum]URD91848.1 hypothetical protein MUK42_04500 [Musa troglodytarum]
MSDLSSSAYKSKPFLPMPHKPPDGYYPKGYILVTMFHARAAFSGHCSSCCSNLSGGGGLEDVDSVVMGTRADRDRGWSGSSGRGGGGGRGHAMHHALTVATRVPRGSLPSCGPRCAMGKRQSLCLCDAWGQTRAPRSDHVDLSFLASPPPHSSIPSHPIPSHAFAATLTAAGRWCAGRDLKKQSFTVSISYQTAPRPDSQHLVTFSNNESNQKVI